MSWAVEEWKDGLPGKALQRIQEMEVQLDKLKKERTQKQFQMESLEAALQKQKQKVDNERNEISALKRENQSLVESCDSVEKARQKAIHDLGVKEQQVNYLDGQLNACKKTIERLELELKKYKNEFDRSQPAGACSAATSFDIPAFSTPQKGFATPAAIQTYRSQDNRLEDLQEKYNQEAEERKRLENELKLLQVKLLNQSSVTVSHKDIAARQQAGSSVFPWQQQEQIHSRHAQDTTETPLKRRGASLWEAHEETPIKTSQRMSCSIAMPSPGRTSQQMDHLKTLNQELRSRVSELERNLANQEKELKSQNSKLQDIQTQLNQARKDLSERERDLVKKSHELSQTTDKHQQVLSKCTSMEQKLKQVTDEMNCQRHNAESCKRALEQKLKDLERDSQKEKAQLQNIHETLERQMDQTKTKLSQEIQQSKKELNILQSDMEKIHFQKSNLEKEVEEHKQKLLRSEQSLQSCQTKEHDLRKKMEELQKEKNCVSVQLDQSNRRLNQLEDEKKSSDQTLKRTQGLLDDLKAKSEGQTEELKRLQSKLEQQTQDLDNMKRTLSEAETKNSKFHSDLLNQKQEREQLTQQITLLEKECQELKYSLSTSQNLFAELKEAHETILQWKTDKESLINDTEAVQNGLKEQLYNSEKSVNLINEDNTELKKQLAAAEEKQMSLSAQIDSLKGELLNKCTELEEKEHQYKELQSKFSQAGLEHSKDLENVGVQVAQLQAQVKDLEINLQKEVARAEQAERMNTQLQDEQEAASDLISSKDQLVELGRAEIVQLRESLALSTAQQEEQTERLAEEKAAYLKRCEDTVLLKETESEQLKLHLEEAQQELLLAKNKITTTEQFLKVQEQLGEELQKQVIMLTETGEQHNKMLNEKIDEVEQKKQELRFLQSDADEKDRCYKMAGDQIQSLEKQRLELESSIEQMKKDRESSDNTMSEKINNLCEQILLLEKNVAEGKDAAARLPVLEDELDKANGAHAELKKCLEALQKDNSSITEVKSNLENAITEKNSLITSLELNIKEITEKMQTDSENHALEIKHFHNEEGRLKDLLEGCKNSEAVAKAELRSRREEIKTMKTTISAASSGLQERDNTIVSLKEKLRVAEKEQSKTADLLKEKIDAMNKIKVQMEMLQMDLEDNETVMNSFENQTEELRGTIESLEAQIHHTQAQMSEMEIKLEDSKAQVSVLETRLEEVQALNSSLEAQYVTAKEELMDRSCEITRLEEVAARQSQVEDDTAELLNNLDTIKQENEKLEATLRQIIQYKDLLVTEKNNIENNMIQVNIEKKELKDNINHLTEENRQFETKISELTKEKNKLEIELSQAVEEKRLLETNNTALEEKNELLKMNIAESHEQKQYLEKNMSSYETELSVLRDLKNSMEQSLKSSEQEQNKLKDELDTRARRNEEDLRERANYFEVEQAKLHEKLSDLQTELIVFKEKYNILQEQVTNQHEIIVQLSESKTSESPAKPCGPTEPEMELIEEADVSGTQPILVGMTMEDKFKNTEAVPNSYFNSEMEQVCEIQQECLQNVCASDEVNISEEDQLPENSGALPTTIKEYDLTQKCKESSEVLFDQEVEAQHYKLLTLNTEIDLLNADLELRKEISAEMETYVKKMEKKMTEFEKEAQEASRKLTVVLKENGGLLSQVSKLSDDNESLTLQLQTAKSQLTDIMEMLEGLEMAKGGWDEKFLQQESELKRVRSEKANLEQHILGMEGELETLQEEGTKLKQELETKRRAFLEMENNIERFEAEITQLRTELVTCTEERDEMSQSLSRCKEQIYNLEKNNSDTRELISILEDDNRATKKDHDILQSNLTKLKTEREQLLDQIKTLEQTLCQQCEEKQELTGHLNKIQEDHTSDILNTESMASKIQTLEGEVSRLSHSLESSLMEKGEIASRLNATQDEVQQMRTGIEKLQVRIEADERKKKKMGELLKAAQRKADSLQDRIHALDREKEDMEQSLEEAVVQVETVKAELEEQRRMVEEEKRELSKKLTELSAALDNLKQEKESMEQELKIKREEIEVLKAAKEELERGLEQVQIDRQNEVHLLERGMKEAAEKQTKEVGDLQAQVEHLNQKTLALEEKSTKLESEKTQMHNLILEFEIEKQRLCTQEEQWASERKKQKTHIGVLENEIGELKSLIATKEEEQKALNVTWQESITSLSKEKQTTEDQNKQLQDAKDQLDSALTSVKLEKEELQCALAVLKGKNENLNSDFLSIEKEKNNLLQLLSSMDEEKVKLELEKQAQEAEMHKCQSLIRLLKEDKEKLDATVSSFEKEKQGIEEAKEKLEEQKNVLQSSVSSLEQELERQKSSMSDLNNQVSELASRAACLSNEKDSALGKINLWMKTCKQLEEEKQAMLNNPENGNSREELNQLKMAAEERQKELQDLSAALEEKRNEAQQKNEKLEELNHSLDVTREELKTKNIELEDAKNNLNELSKLVEEKSQEADESMDKYCTLMIQVHKLEQTNDALTARLEQITSKQTKSTNIQSSSSDGLRRSSRKSSSKLQMNDNTENLQSTPQRSPLAKRSHGDITDKDAAQEALHNLTKKIKATAATTPKPPTEQDKDFRPEGLPELVQKGFADIPIGEASPFIVRRTTVRRCSPRLVAKQTAITTSATDSKVLEPLHLQSPTVDVKTNKKSLSLSAEEDAASFYSNTLQNTSEQEPAQGENCHVQ